MLVARVSVPTGYITCLSVIEEQTHHRSLLEAHHGHGPSATGRRPLCDRPVARPRILGYNPNLLGSDAGDEGTGAQQNEPAEWQIQTVSTWGPTSWLS